MPGIRYQIFVTHIGPSSTAVLLSSLAVSFLHPLSWPPRRAPLPHDSRMCFVCTTACKVWAPRYLSYGRGRTRTGCTLHSAGPAAHCARLIMVILSRRCKLRRSQGGYTRLRSGCFRSRKGPRKSIIAIIAKRSPSRR